MVLSQGVYHGLTIILIQLIKEESDCCPKTHIASLIFFKSFQMWYECVIAK